LLAELGLTYPQYLLLMVLWETDGVSLGQLAERVDLPAHGVTPVVNRLVDGGWVQRRPDPSDARVSRVFLTESGTRLAHDAGLAQAAVVCRTGLTPEALADLREQLTALARQTGGGRS
jgi:MarR family transcriptional regulator, organic hydroperoxide resistance regulator